VDAATVRGRLGNESHGFLWLRAQTLRIGRTVAISAESPAPPALGQFEDRLQFPRCGLPGSQGLHFYE
jgi:hypothetical protein